MYSALKKAYRSQVTKLVNQANDIPDNEEFNNDEIKVLILRIKSINESLNKVNNEISDDLTADNLESECEKIVEYQDKVTAAVARLECIMAKKGDVAGKLDLDDDDRSNSSHDSRHRQSVAGSQTGRQTVAENQTATGAVGYVRLPKLELLKFNGDHHAWPAFWEQFSNTIHTNANLDETSKFTYLKSVLTSNAAIVVQGLTSSHSSYNDAIELLKEQFGNSEKIIDNYVQQLLVLPAVKKRNDVVSLRKLYNTTSKITRSLKTLGMSPMNYGMLVKSVVLKALPFSLRAEFHKSCSTGELDDSRSITGSAAELSDNKDIYENQISQLLNFIKLEVESIEQAKVLDDVTTKDDDKGSDSKFKSYKKDSQALCTAAGLFTTAKEQCLFCKSTDHRTVNCRSKISLEEKKEILKTERRCYRCTKGNHNSKFCRTKISCDKCKAKHATTMCDPNYKVKLNTAKSDSSEQTKHSTNLLASGSLNNVYLQTACVQIQNLTGSGVPQKSLRLVIDGGSQLTFIKECVSRQLNLPITGTHKIAIMPFGKSERSPARICNRVSLTLKNNYDNDFTIIEAIEVPEICFESLKAPSLEDSSVYEFSINYPLADSPTINVDVIPGISLLIGADSYWKVVTGNIQKIKEGLMGVETKFGWTIHGVGSGRYYDEYPFSFGINVVNSLHVQCEQVREDFDLKKFWTLEAIGIDSDNSNEKHLTTKFSRDNITFNNNRYCVSLPWLDSNVHIDSNYSSALNRLKSLTRKLSNGDKLREYDSAIREYMKTGCAEFSPKLTNECRTYFMPHRAVYRDDKSTSKIRIVCDASAHAIGFPSLNDVIWKGENLVPHLFRVLLNFRFGGVALIADIEKAFLQIELTECDRDSHSFLWYEKPIDDLCNLPKIAKFRMKRVTFGVTCSPFLLAVVLKEHLKSQPEQVKDICDLLSSSFYVDDLVIAVNDVGEAEIVYHEAKKVMSKASMNLRKWASNDPAMRRLIGDDLMKNSVKKVLGILWYSADDQLSIDLNSLLETINDKPITKRTVLQAVSRIFDPLGFLCPFVIRAKILLQSIWKAKLDWDASLPEKLSNDWLKWCSELSTLKDYSLPRCVLQNIDCEYSLHIFADASPVAYGTVAYLRVDKKGEIESNFLMSKCRVAPIKDDGQELTLPKLELTAAVCAARLQNFILTNVKINIKYCALWTDSKITLHWINGSNKKWKPYVRNRVAEIQKVSVGVWRHCPGPENPADLLTRGMKSSSLLNSEIWKHGPDWLKASCEEWPENDFQVEMGSLSVFAVQATEIKNINSIFPIDRFNSLERIFRVTAYVMRFVYNLRNKESRNLGHITTQNLKNSENYWLRITQQQHFSSELSALTKGEPIDQTSSILTLNPFLDNNEIMRLGGRLHEAPLPFKTKHPVILPKKSTLTDRIIWNAHIVTNHGGVNLTITNIRKEFWIIQCRQRIKSVLNKCIICKKMRVKAGNEPFPPLPRSRVSEASPFKVVGTDFAGPLYIVSEANVKKKVYIMLFTCAVVRAVHLELVPDLTTGSCINGLRRFISRRGVPDIIYSDNAKCYKRASLELQQLNRITCDKKFQDFASRHRIEWKFIVERAAWWGGFWERMVKTVKDALKLSLGKKSLRYDELVTILIEIEATVNSRPLTYIDNDPENLFILTPSHFLIGGDECGFSIVGNHPDIKGSDILKKWKDRDERTRRFWKKWSCEYLQQLRLFHNKSSVKSRTFKVGDVALLHDQNIPRLLWKLVRITQVFQGRDGKVRACEIMTSNKTILRRPIQLLFPLEITAAGEDVENSSPTTTAAREHEVRKDIPTGPDR